MVAKSARASHDSAWKDILDQYLPQALEQCFPDLYHSINWDLEWMALDKELQAITKDSQTGLQHVDKLIRVFLLDGQEPWILIHLEVEQSSNNKFPERMLIYGARAYDKYRHPIFSCAILTDSNQIFRPSFYEIKVGRSRLRLDFDICKLIDFAKDRDKLEKSKSPFDMVICYHLNALLAKKQEPNERLETKISLTKRLYQQGLKKVDILNLYRFLDFSIALPKNLELQYREKIYRIDEEKNMAYISSIERFGMQQGMQQGIEMGRVEQKVEIAKNLMKLDNVDVETIALVTGLSVTKVNSVKQDLTH